MTAADFPQSKQRGLVPVILTSEQMGESADTKMDDDPRPQPSGKVAMPCVVLNHNLFFSSDHFDPKFFNAWSKRSGWQQPFHIYLLCQWGTWLVVVLGFFLFNARFLSDEFRVAAFVVMGLLSFAQAVFSFWTMSINTEDPNVRLANVQRNIDFIKYAGVPVIDPATGFCNICNVVVAPTTKHCKPCNKCVAQFDHHCPYLSTCIGGLNYRQFFTTSLLTSITTTLYGAIACYVISQYYTRHEDFQSQLASMFGQGPNVGIAVVSVVFLYSMICIVIAGAMWYLTIFHIRLMAFGISTLEYLENRGAGERNPWRKTAPKSEHRIINGSGGQEANRSQSDHIMDVMPNQI
ncbi:DHHC palmitoyltransferase-domain-containing protein [Polychytrium aggregatum]|uniref:DHHC palmitoyltransferase-domain-containing protein n=1 Tax=Polychytrium aggregatum TaxID=110093 RepID=UPI0022FEB69B|nr:DHHC palmitoyltransferase-domain-containing protein [Polychytrium aggregatum]KAI9201849.1 DHHC palmitoyltransferase-domain-containing protein [Polychytrium aggregatum]